MIIGFILTTLVTAVCIRFYDVIIASYVRRLGLSGSVWHKLAADIPDVLLLMVCVITAIAGVCYFTRKKKGVYDRNTMFFHLVMYAAPASFIAKSLCKYVFGRVTTREWLIKPELYGFHWLHGGDVFGGFPSGHMVVFTAVAAALWRYYPRYRALCASSPLILAFALIITNYHFLSDVIAGAYLGVLIEFCTYKGCSRCRLPG